MAQKAGTAVPESGAHAKVFPPLDPGTFAPQLVWLALSLGLLYLLLKRVALPRVGEVIEERADRIKRDLEQAEKLKAETEAALANYEQALGEARTKANAMAKGMRDKLTAEVGKERAEAIRKELDEARRLREAAQTLLADYQKKHRSVGQEAEAILALARREADTFAQETRVSLKETLERRTRLAEDKIARAEAQAVDEVRASAIDVALAAAEKILREKMTGSGGAALVD